MEKVIITDNKVPVYYYPNNHLHRFCLTLYVKAGSMYEKGRQRGITHYWEHMIFRNVDASLDGNMKKNLDKIGAYFNASTYREYVEIKIIAACRHFDECADILTRVFDGVKYSDEDINIERKRIKAEIREDDEKSTLDYFSNKIVWKNTSLSYCIAGKSELLDGMDREVLSKYNKEILTPENMFFYVTGTFNESNIDYLCKCINKYQFESANIIRDNFAPVPKKFMNRDAKVKVKNSDCNKIRFSFDFDSTKYKRAELDLLYDILFDGECSKIYETLSDKTGLIYSYDSILEQYSNIGSIYFSYEVKGKKLLESTDIVIDTLKVLKRGIEDELDYVKVPYTDNADMDLDEPEKINWIMAYERHILGQGYTSMDERIKAYEEVTPERITEIAREIFTIDNMVVTVKTDKKKIKAEDISRLVRAL